MIGTLEVFARRKCNQIHASAYGEFIFDNTFEGQIPDAKHTRVLTFRVLGPEPQDGTSLPLRTRLLT